MLSTSIRVLSLSFVVCLSVFLSAPVGAAVWKITYPQNVNADSIHNQYVIQLLDLALQKTGVRYELIESEHYLSQQKSIQLVSENRSINVMWSMTDSDREKLLTPIRIPLYKGLIGWRVLLMHEKNRLRLADLDMHNIREHSVVQGLNWPDNKILRNNGFTVITAVDHDEAFAMMRKRQVDLFPRSVIEVLDELAKPSLSKGLMLESELVLHYPTAVYFFVNNGDTILRKLIEKGLRAAVADGSMDALFEATYAPLIEQLNLRDRITLSLDNPLLPTATPVEDFPLWYRQ